MTNSATTNNSVTTYQQAVDFLNGRLNYERVAANRLVPRNFQLDRMRQLLALIDSPEKRVPAIHVAGTKGKGSTAVMIAEMLQASGRKVGLFTSPHINRFEERMTVNSQLPTPEKITELINRLIEPVAQLDAKSDDLRPTYFEIINALAWLFFCDQKTEIDVLEVGLGGRLDSTNVCHPVITVITNIGFDHMHLLGKTLGEIAKEKSGILKKGVPLVCGETDPKVFAEIESIANEQNCPVWQRDREVTMSYHRAANSVDVKTPFRQYLSMPLPLVGKHQADNASVAIASVDWLRNLDWPISETEIRNGLAAVNWPLRFERLRQSPDVIVDAAHNESSVRSLCETIDAECSATKRILIFSASRDKDIETIASDLFPHFDEIILTAFVGNPRAVSVDELSERVTLPSESKSIVHTATTPFAAWELATQLANDDDLICATGSFFLAAEIRAIVLAEDREHLPPNVSVHHAEKTNGECVDDARN